MLGWSQWIVSLAHWAQPGSRLVRASVHQKIHEQDAVFGKVLHSELMIPSIRHDHHFYDNRICDNVFLVWIYLKRFLLILAFFLNEREDIKQQMNKMKYLHELFACHSSQWDAERERIKFHLFSWRTRDGWKCAALSLQLHAATSGGKGKRLWMMVDDPSQNYLCMPTQSSGPGGARQKSDCGSLEYLHVKARSEIFSNSLTYRKLLTLF